MNAFVADSRGARSLDWRRGEASARRGVGAPQRRSGPWNTSRPPALHRRADLDDIVGHGNGNPVVLDHEHWPGQRGDRVEQRSSRW